MFALFGPEILVYRFAIYVVELRHIMVKHFSYIHVICTGFLPEASWVKKESRGWKTTKTFCRLLYSNSLTIIVALKLNYPAQNFVLLKDNFPAG